MILRGHVLVGAAPCGCPPEGKHTGLPLHTPQNHVVEVLVASEEKAVHRYAFLLATNY